MPRMINVILSLVLPVTGEWGVDKSKTGLVGPGIRALGPICPEV